MGGRFSRGARIQPALLALACEFDDQDGILGGQTDQHHQTDLGQDIVVAPPSG